MRSDERVFNLVLALLSTRDGLTKRQIFGSVRGYADTADSDITALERRFERDKAFLRDVGVDITVEDDPATLDNQSQRYRILRESFEFPHDVEFTAEEARLIALAGVAWQQASLSETSQAMLIKLAGLGAEVEAPPVAAPRMTITEPNLGVLTSAVSQQRLVEFRYRAAGFPSAVTRRAIPLHLFLFEGRWHVFAWSPDSGAFRTYLLARIDGPVSMRRAKTVLDAMPTPPTLDSVVDDMHELASHNVAVVRVDAGSEAEVRLGRRGSRIGDGRIQMHFTDAELLADELCSYGPEVEVEGPPALRRLVISSLRMIRDAHDEEARRGEVK